MTSSFQKLLVILDELESLKPEFHRRVDEMNRKMISGADTSSLEWLPSNKVVLRQQVYDDWFYLMSLMMTWFYLMSVKLPYVFVTHASYFM